MPSLTLIGFRFARPTVLVLLGAVLGGCYSFTEIDGPPTPGVDVRAELTNEGAIRQSVNTGNVAMTYDGRLLGLTEEGLSLSVVTLRVQNAGQRLRTMRATLLIPTEDIERIRVRRLDKIKTTLVALAGAFVVWTGVNSLVDVGGDSPDGEGPPPDAGFRPTIRIPVGR